MTKDLNPKPDKDQQKDENKISRSRHDFLKKASLGAAGLGAAAMLPNAADLEITSDKGLQYSDKSGNSSFSVKPSGQLNTPNVATDQIIFNQQKSASAVNSGKPGVYADCTGSLKAVLPDGSGSKPEGLYRSDSNNNLWMRVADNGANTILY